MILYIIIGNGICLTHYKFANERMIVGVDKGALLAIHSNVKLDYVVGDFDSLSPVEKQIVFEKIKNVKQLDPVKDVTDTYHAYKSFNKGMESIVILGGIQGNRIEHFLANINLLKLDKRISIEDDYSIINRYDGPCEARFKNDNYKYYSFFGNGKAVISLKGFKFELDKYELNEMDNLCISNEMAKSGGVLSVHSGSIILIKSKDDIDFR